jgi:uncharacterized membrane protein YdbT with pleckstrin-like domain
VLCLIAGFYILGKIVLRLGLAKAIRNWAQSLDYRLNEESLSIKSCFALWGFVLYRQEKRIPLEKITDLQLVQGPILNAMELWIIRVQTASTGGSRPEATLYAPENPHQTRDKILHVITHSKR